MKKLSKRTLLVSISAIILWMVGSYFMFKNGNGLTTIIIIAFIITAGLYSQLKKDLRINSEK